LYLTTKIIRVKGVTGSLEVRVRVRVRLRGRVRVRVNLNPMSSYPDRNRNPNPNLFNSPSLQSELATKSAR
jgi:hypothetical protein